MRDLLQMYDPKGYTVTVRQLDLGLSSDNYRAILRRVKVSGDNFIVAHCSAEMLPELLKQAQQVGLMTEHHSWFITSPDMHTLDLEPFMHAGTNITGIRLIDPEDPRVVQITSYWAEQEKEKGNEMSPRLEANSLPTAIALMFDSVQLFATAFHQLHGTVQPVPLNCEDGETMTGGYSFQNIMKTSHGTHGLTREIKFDHKGKRTEFEVDIVELDSSGLNKVGVWNASHGVVIARMQVPTSAVNDEGSLKNRSFVVITALSPPYGMLKESAATLVGNEQLEGFGIDLIHELSLMLGFNYTFELQKDGVYGSPVNGQWNGMVRELLDHVSGDNLWLIRGGGFNKSTVASL